MTIFGWDASHFDGWLNADILRRARAEGISFFTHKIAEGVMDTEGTHDDSALAAARDAGIPFIGGYLIPRSNASPASQVDYWLKVADASEPWWRTFPGWFWQIDLEMWGYDNVSAATGIDCAQRLRAATGKQVILYASRGQYGDSLTGWDGPLWNADYRGGPDYPGDGWTVADKGAPAGWAPYSGKTPVILQYTSSATIAGLTTCDKNAFRGSEDDFRALIGEQEVALKDDPDGCALMWRVESLCQGSDTVIGNSAATGEDLSRFYDKIAARVAAKLPQNQPVQVVMTQDQLNAAVAANVPAIVEALAQHIKTIQ